jgi:hypothetical protein
MFTRKQLDAIKRYLRTRIAVDAGYEPVFTDMTQEEEDSWREYLGKRRALRQNGGE